MKENHENLSSNVPFEYLPTWFQKAITKDAIVEYNNDILTWIDGRWFHSTWEDGIWHNGFAVNLEWKNGIWYNGSFDGGQFLNGIWYGGQWKHGLFKGGIWRSKDSEPDTHYIYESKKTYKNTRGREIYWLTDCTGYYHHFEGIVEKGELRDGVWFPQSEIVQLRKNNHENLMSNVPFEDLPEWFQKAKTKNAILDCKYELIDTHKYSHESEKERDEYYRTPKPIWMSNVLFITWVNGIWIDGISESMKWKDGIWENGKWQDGTWEHGIWKNGTWKDGVWENGRWENGHFLNGIWYKGIWENGAFSNGTWFNGIWFNGIMFRTSWYDGTWLDGTFMEDGFSSWEKGTWINGIREKKDSKFKTSLAGETKLFYTQKYVSINSYIKTYEEWDKLFESNQVTDYLEQEKDLDYIKNLYRLAKEGFSLC